MHDHKPRLAWALTGSGHYLKESLEIALELPHVDLYLSKASAEVVHMYAHSLKELRARFRVFRDTTASAAPVGLFYWPLSHRGHRARHLEHRGQMRVWHFRQPGNQHLCSGREVPNTQYRLRL